MYGVFLSASAACWVWPWVHLCFLTLSREWVWGRDETKNRPKGDFFPSRFFGAPAWTDLLFSVSLHLAAPNWPGELLILLLAYSADLSFWICLNPDAMEGHSQSCSWWQQEEQRHSWCFGSRRKEIWWSERLLIQVEGRSSALFLLAKRNEMKTWLENVDEVRRG